MAEGEGSFVVDSAGSGEFALGEILWIKIGTLKPPEQDSAGLDVVGGDGGGEDVSFLDGCG